MVFEFSKLEFLVSFHRGVADLEFEDNIKIKSYEHIKKPIKSYRYITYKIIILKTTFKLTKIKMNIFLETK